MKTIDWRGFGIALAIGVALSLLLGLCTGLLTQAVVANAQLNDGMPLTEVGTRLAGLSVVLACVTGLIIGAGMGIGYVRGGRREWMLETSDVVTGLGAVIAAHTAILWALSCVMTVAPVVGMAATAAMAGDEIGFLLGSLLASALIPLCASVIAICIGAFPTALLLRPKA